MRNQIPKSVTLIPEQAKRVFRGVIFDVYQWQQELYDASYKTFEMLRRPDTVVVIAIRDGKIVVLEQEQPGMDTFYDFPSGRNDVESEGELDAAKRETVEETGMTFAKWKLVDVSQPHTKIDWLVYKFIATDFIDEQPQKLDGGERIKVMLKTFEELKELAKDPRARYIAKDLEKIHSLEDLLALTEIS